MRVNLVVSQDNYFTTILFWLQHKFNKLKAYNNAIIKGN